MIGDRTFLILKGPCLLGASLIDGRSRCKFRPSNQTISPILKVRSKVLFWAHFFWAFDRESLRFFSGPFPISKAQSYGRD